MSSTTIDKCLITSKKRLNNQPRLGEKCHFFFKSFSYHLTCCNALKSKMHVSEIGYLTASVGSGYDLRLSFKCFIQGSNQRDIS